MIITKFRIETKSGQAVCVGRAEGNTNRTRYLGSFTCIYSALFLKLVGMYMTACYIIFYTLYISKIFCDK